MDCRSVYRSKDNATADVTAFIHEDGEARILLSPVAANGRRDMTLNLHWTVEDARRVASDLLAASDAIEVDRANHVEDAAEGRAAMELAK